MAREKVASKCYNLDTGTASVKFADGVSVHLNLDDLPSAIIRQLALHGALQKLGDSFAGRDDKGWSIADCRAEAQRIVDALQRGVFNGGRDGGGNSLLAEALARATGRTVDAASTVVAGLTDVQRKALEKNPQVKAALLTIKAERAAAKVATLPDGPAGRDLIDMF